MASMAMVVILALVAAVAEAQYGGGSCDWSQCRYDRYLAQRCCSSSGTCCDFANGGNNGNNNNGGFNNNNKPGSCPPYNGRKIGPRGEDSPATTGARATTPATTMAMGITPAMAMATTRVMAMATVTTTTGAVVSETASVLPTSSAATSARATSAPGQTTMVDQLIWSLLLFDIDLEI